MSQSLKFESKTLQDDKDPLLHYEEGTLIHEGEKYSSGGSHIWFNKKLERYEGIFYQYFKENMIGNWEGSEKVKAHYGHVWFSNFSDERQSVYFTWKGIKFYGVWMKSFSCIVRARQIKNFPSWLED